MWALALVGGTGEKGLDSQDAYWLMLWSLRQLVDVSSAKYCAQKTQVLSDELHVSFPNHWHGTRVVGCTMEGTPSLAWLQRCGKQETMGNAVSAVLLHSRGRPTGVGPFLQYPVAEGPLPFLLKSKLQVAVEQLRSPRQDSATAPSFCSYGSLFEPSGSNFLTFIFIFSVNFYVVVWSNRPKHQHTRTMQVSRGRWTGPAHLTQYIMF